MNAFSSINLASLPQPNLVEPRTFEAILADLKADVITRAEQWVPNIARVLELESDLATILLQAFAYRELLKIAELNDAAKENTLAFATGAPLENFGANVGVTRKVIDPGDDTAVPPLPEVLESDNDLRRRIQLAYEGLTSAGSTGAYMFHSLNASEQVSDAYVESPQPGEVLVTVLSREADGTPSFETLEAVTAALAEEDARDLCALVSVQAATIVTFDVDVQLEIAPGPDPAVVLDAATAALTAYVEADARLGRPVTLSRIYAALEQEGVDRVHLAAPAADLEITPQQAAHCTGITVAQGDGS